MIRDAVEVLKEIGPSFKLEPFASIIQPIIEQVLNEHNKNKFRKGTILTPQLMVWFVLALTLRRDINYPKILNWLISAFRWLHLDFPTQIVADGAITRARIKLGVDVFRCIFNRIISSFKDTIKPDFYQWKTVIFDGVAMCMPDTKSNVKKFGKHKSGRGSGAFPQLRAMALMTLLTRRVLDLSYAAIKGKKTGEKTLMLKILKRCKATNFLFLFDAGFYSFFFSMVLGSKWP